jgi:hypothetical protein
MKTVIGIDPGRNGAYSLIGSEGDAPKVMYYRNYKLPAIAGKRFQWLIDLFRMCPYTPEAGVIEHPILMYHVVNGVRVARNRLAYDTQMKDFESLKNVIDLSFGVELVEVYPPTWKAFHQIKNGTGKMQSMLLASKYCHCEDHNEADAVLIGIYAWYKLGFEVADLPEVQHGTEGDYVKNWRKKAKEDLLLQFGADPLIFKSRMKR